MKGMGDAQGDLGETVHDRAPALIVLSGLNEKFQYMAALIKPHKLFPSYGNIHADLEHKEINMATSVTAPSTVLVTMPPAQSPAMSAVAAPPVRPAA
jgi:hypothetical protein